MPDFDAAQAFFLDEVRPTTREFIEDVANVRRGRLAAITLVQTADHVWHFKESHRRGTTSADRFRSRLAAACEAYERLLDTAHASKHGVLRNTSTRLRRIGQSSDVAAAELFGRAPWGGFRLGGGAQAALECVDGHGRALDVQVMKVSKTWSGLLGLDGPPLPGSRGIGHWTERMS